MNRAQEVLHAAKRRATALATGDEAGLRETLHPDFVWTSHLGERFNLDSYVRSNVSAGRKWHSQRLTDARVIPAGDAAAVLTCIVTDVIDDGHGAATFHMPMTQVWVDDGTAWRCLAGHAGPRIDRS